jgi:succinoglycan biosynthesis protein ExoV
MLGLPKSLALGDPAALISPALGLPLGGGTDVGFMPHFESASRGSWQEAADRAGVRLIDPRGSPVEILQSIGRCKLLLSEALHGVIVADALRVPWVAIRPQARIHRAKWSDWADTMELEPRFGVLPASTVAEWACNSHLGSWRPAHAWLDRQQQRLAMISPARLVASAAEALRKAASSTPQLSTASTLDRCQSRMLEAVHAMRLRPLRGVSSTASDGHPRTRLHGGENSAYQLTPIN